MATNTNITNLTNEVIIPITNFISNLVTDIKWGKQDDWNVVLGFLGLLGTLAIIYFARKANQLQNAIKTSQDGINSLEAELSNSQKILNNIQKEWYNNELRGELAIQDIKLRNVFSLISGTEGSATAEIVLTIENLFGGLVYDIFVDYEIYHKDIQIVNSTKRWIFISGRKTKDFIIRFPLTNNKNEVEEINEKIKKQVRTNLDNGIQQHSWEATPMLRAIGQYRFVFDLANDKNGTIVPQNAITVMYDLSENEWIWIRS